MWEHQELLVGGRHRVRTLSPAGHFQSTTCPMERSLPQGTNQDLAGNCMEVFPDEWLLPRTERT